MKGLKAQGMQVLLLTYRVAICTNMSFHLGRKPMAAYARWGIVGRRSTLLLDERHLCIKTSDATHDPFVLVPAQTLQALAGPVCRSFDCIVPCISSVSIPLWSSADMHQCRMPC